MEAPPKTLLDLRLTIDLEIEWDSFRGRTKEQFIRMVEDDVFDAIREARPEVQEIYRIQTQENHV
jgi:hypothetical protein